MKKTLSAFFLVALFLGLIFGLHYLLFSLAKRQGIFEVQSIEVNGATYSRKSDIIRYSGIEWGDSLFDVDLLTAAAKTTDHPYISFAVVKRIPPSTILIEVTEQSPIAVVSDGENSYVCDKDGNVMETGSATGLPLLRTDYTVSEVDGAVLDSFVIATLKNLSEFSGSDIVANIVIKEGEGTYMTLNFLPDTLFYIGANIADEDFFTRVISIGDQITNLDLDLSYVDVTSESGVGF